METPENILARVLKESIAVKQQMLPECAEPFSRFVEASVKALQEGHKLLLCGNGGSACDAQHVVGELVGRFLMERRPLPAVALTADSAILTCVGNDYGFEEVFARQVEALAQKGDIVVGISTSGNSPNVRRALEAAHRCGALSVAITGQTGGKLREVADICLCVPSTATARIQEAHITLWHAFCEAVEQRLFRS